MAPGSERNDLDRYAVEPLHRVRADDVARRADLERAAFGEQKRALCAQEGVVRVLSQIAPVRSHASPRIRQSRVSIRAVTYQP